MTTNVEIQEVEYVDRHAGVAGGSGSDKFYRIFVFDSSWLVQYGRNGTVGTFGKITVAASPVAAKRAAEAKLRTKTTKGYVPSRSGTIMSPTAIDESNKLVLDQYANTLKQGVTTHVVSPQVAPVVLSELDDLTDEVNALLAEGFVRHAATVEDVNPANPVRPMLASVQNQSIVDAAMLDPEWLAQYKYDGDRLMVESRNGEVRAFNRAGEAKTRNVSTLHLTPFTALHFGRWVFDGEIVGRTLVLFDIAAAGDGKSTWVREGDGFKTRYRALQLIASVLGIPMVADAPANAPVVVAPVAYTQKRKNEFLASAIADQREGIILRHGSGLYEGSRRSNDLVKHKLIKDADVIVTSLHSSKDSAGLSVHLDDGTLFEVGSASTIGKGAVNVGDVWVVTYLYVTDPQAPRLVQPRLVRSRDDKPASDCLIGQFADAGTARIV